jgi:RHS repeat-associated protein
MHQYINSLTKNMVCNYNPSTGRFLSEDPIGFKSGDVNFYRYVGNSPLRYVDPFGWKITNQPVTLTQLQVIMKSPRGCNAYRNNFRTEDAQSFRFVKVDGNVFDMRHLVTSYKITKYFGGNELAAVITLFLGTGLEYAQFFGLFNSESGAEGSGFSEEDIPSNELGAAYGTGSAGAKRFGLEGGSCGCN